MNLGDMKGAIVILAVAVLIAASTAIALNDFRGDTDANSYAQNITDAGLEGVDNVSQYFDTIGTIIGIAVLITLIVGAFSFISGRK